MQVKAKRNFSSPYTGNAIAGKVYDLPDAVAIQMMDYDLVEREKSGGPFGVGGEDKPSASSQAGQASPENSASTSGENAGSSQSTPVTSSPHGPTSSTDATPRGGSDITKRPRRGRKGGRKTGSQQSD